MKQSISQYLLSNDSSNTWSCYTKDSYRNLQTTGATTKAIGCSPQPDDKDLMVKTTPIQLIEHREIELGPS